MTGDRADRAGDLDARIREELRAWRSAGLGRELPGDAELTRAPAGDFESNDYLGLSRDARVVDAARAALEEFGAGGRSARLLGGGSPLAARSEKAAAEWLGTETALLFPSGYQANLGVVGALARRGDALFSDELNHASLIDACRLSRAHVHVFRHRDLDELARQLALANGARRRLVVSETIFGMDGDRAPLAGLHELCERHDAWLVLDEAHAAGLLGPQGAGALAEEQARGLAPRRVAARIVTGGKSLGVGGAFALGTEAVRDVLLNRARAFVFTTAPPPMVAGALLAAVEACRGADELRERALQLARRMARALAQSTPDAAIVPVAVGDAARTIAIGRELAAAGFGVGAVRPPTVPEGSSRLRVVAHSFNDEASVDELARRIVLSLRTSRGEKAANAGSDSTSVRREPAEPPWFVVGTDTGVGKTVVSALLLRAARALGPAAYWKPVQTGDEDDTASVRALASATPHELLENAWRFPLPASPHEAAAAARSAIDPDRLLDARPGEDGRRVVVELAGGLLVPYRAGDAPFLQSDWITKAGARARVVVVARSGLGTLNHTLLTLEALRARHVEPAALFLVGERHASNVATLRQLSGVSRIFEVPRFEPLDSAALERWLEENDLRLLLAAAGA